MTRHQFFPACPPFVNTVYTLLLKVASIPPDCSYLGQLVIIRDIVKGLYTCTDHIHLIARIEFCENLIYDCMHSYEW